MHQMKKFEKNSHAEKPPATENESITFGVQRPKKVERDLEMKKKTNHSSISF